MITREEILILHKIAVKQYGGSDEIRDENLLQSAISRPFQTFEGNELYPTPEEKACALLQSIITNHPFIDGNKRTGYLAYRLLLLNSGKDIKATQAEKYKFVIAIASGKMDAFQYSQRILRLALPICSSKLTQRPNP